MSYSALFLDPNDVYHAYNCLLETLTEVYEFSLVMYVKNGFALKKRMSCI